MKDHYILTVKALDRPGLLHTLTGVINRKLIPIISLNAAPTDVHEIVLVTMELRVSGDALTTLLLKLENIIEVFSAEGIYYDAAISQRSVFFKMDQAFLSSPQSAVIAKWGAQIVSLHEGQILIAKAGNEQLIWRMYNDFEGPYLLGFSQTGLIVDNNLITGDESSVISRLLHKAA